MSKRLFFTQLGWENLEPKNVERNIKLFALINNDLVLPSNHIYSENTEILLRKNPQIFEFDIIRPALDTEFDKISDYLKDREKKAGRSLSDYGNFLDSIKSNPVRYESDSPAGIFTNHALEQLVDSNSVLYQSAKFKQGEVANFITSIQEYQRLNNGVVFFRDFLDGAKKHTNPKSYLVVEKYANLLRYIAGASSKNCNNLLPQENLIDWCLANSNNPQKFILNDETLFWEVFIESVVKMTDGIFSLKDLDKITPQLLDKFSFEDIHQLRSDGVLKSKFSEKYTQIIDKLNIVRTSSDNKLDLLNFEEIINIKEQIRIEFQEALSQEAKIYRELELLEAMAKVAYQLWGGTLQTIDAVINFFTIAFDKRQNWSKFLEKQENRVSVASKFVSKRMSGEAVLLDYMNTLVNKAKNSWYK